MGRALPGGSTAPPPPSDPLHSPPPPPQRTSASQVLDSAWDKASSGGNPTKPTYARNPQFALTVRKRSHFVIVLIKMDARGADAGADESPATNIRVFNTDGKKLTNPNAAQLLANSGTYDYANSVWLWLHAKGGRVRGHKKICVTEIGLQFGPLS